MFLIPTLTLIGPVFCCRGPGQEFPAHPPHILDTVPRTKKNLYLTVHRIFIVVLVHPNCCYC